MNQYDNNRGLIVKAAILALFIVLPLIGAYAHFHWQHQKYEKAQQYSSQAIVTAFGALIEKNEYQLLRFANGRLEGSLSPIDLTGADQFWIQGDTITRLKGRNNFDMVDLFTIIQAAAQYPYTLTIGKLMRPNHEGELMVPLAIAVHDKRYHQQTGIVVSFIPVDSLLSAMRPLLTETASEVMLVDYKRRLLLSSQWYDTIKQDGFLETSLELFQFDQMQGKVRHPLQFGGTLFKWYAKMERYPFILLIGSTNHAIAFGYYTMSIAGYYVALCAWLFMQKKRKEQAVERELLRVNQPVISVEPVALDVPHSPSVKKTFAKPTKELESVD
ncbi:MAG: hypothetical protein IPP74_07440 [Alphaproteobacteria bacterium]|nr:hypothetical protein [Alphaproteobacteria bacterium]